MKNGERLSLEQIQAFLKASEEFRFEANNREELYGWVTRTLVEQEYGGQKREAKGVLRNYVGKMTGLSRAQVTRLIRRYRESGIVKERSYRRNRFAIQYQPSDVELLAAVDEAHETLSGPATQKIVYREFYEYGDERYQRLATISAAHIYNLRKNRVYRERRACYQKTRPAQVAIGERRRPNPQDRPGYLRIDTVHQGNLEDAPGVYHINAVDEVTQWQVVGATAHISETWLIPVLEAMLRQFPFGILGFHSDNGSEFINHTVARLLNKLLVEQTKSRPRRSNDNGLVEAKNGAVIRKTHGLRAYRVEPRGSHRGVLRTALQPVSKLSSALRCARDGNQRQGQTEEGVPLVRHAVGDPAAVAGPGAAPTGGGDERRLGASGGSGKRHASGPADAGSQAQVICRNPAEKERVKDGGGNDGLWTLRKTKPRFPSASTALGNRCAIPTFPPPRRRRGKVESQNQAFHFPTARFPIPNQTQKGGLAAELRSPSGSLFD